MAIRTITLDADAADYVTYVHNQLTFSRVTVFLLSLLVCLDGVDSAMQAETTTDFWLGASLAVCWAVVGLFHVWRAWTLWWDTYRLKKQRRTH